MANKPQTRLNFHKGYGKNFKRIRIENNLTLENLSEIINFSVKTISAIENESRLPTIEQLNVYVEKFDVPLDFLTGRTKAMNIEISSICEYTGLSEEAVNKLSKIKNTQYSKPVQEYSKNIVVTKLMTAPDNYNQKLLDILSLIISNSKFSDMLQAFQRLKEYHSNKKDNLTYEEEKQLTEILNNENVKLLHKANRWVVTGEGYEKEIKSTIYDTLQNIINEILADDKN